MRTKPHHPIEGAFTFDANRRPKGAHHLVIIADPQDVDEMWARRGQGAKGKAVLDIYGGSGTEGNQYLARRILNEELRKQVVVLADGTVRVPCQNMPEANLRKGTIENFCKTSDEYKLPRMATHLLDETQWMGADAVRENGAGFNSIGIPFGALRVPEGESLVCIPKYDDEGQAVGLMLVIGSHYAELEAEAAAEAADESDGDGGDGGESSGEPAAAVSLDGLAAPAEPAPGAVTDPFAE